MAYLFASFWVELVVLIATVLALYYYYYLKVISQYWAKRNIPHLTPKFLLGNCAEANFTKSLGTIMQELYQNNPDKKVVGLWLFSRPCILFRDVGVIKNVLVKDFNYFHDRGIDINEEKEPLSGNLFNMSGSKWRNLRVKLTPTFTSGKMKMMLPAMVECGEELQEFLKVKGEREETVEMKDILSCFTTDIIATCAFGIKTNSLKNPNSDFRTFGKQIFQPSPYFIFINMFTFVFPFINKLFWFRRMPKGLEDFYMNTVRDTMEYRDKNNVKRRDFLQLLMELKSKGKIEDADVKLERNDEPELEGEVEEQKFTTEQAAAQAFVFFIAGFETSSTTMTFTFYELAQNEDVQRRLQAEMDEVLARHDDKITYEALSEMEYLDWVVEESLRKYPPIPLLFRSSTKDYDVPGTSGKIDKGILTMISVTGLQNDPAVFPDPDKFDPERFSPKEKAKRDNFYNLSFGEGPRNCIGNRFGLLQTKVGLTAILSKYSVDVAETTPIPMVYDPTAFVITPKDGMPLKLTLRK